MLGLYFLRIALLSGIFINVVTSDDLETSLETQEPVRFLGFYQQTNAVLYCSKLPCQYTDIQYWWTHSNSEKLVIYQHKIDVAEHVIFLNQLDTRKPNASKFCFQLPDGIQHCHDVQSSLAGIPGPSNVTAHSSNVNHTLRWKPPTDNYNNYFEVEVLGLIIESNDWIAVNNCHPTKESSCHVYEPIHDIFDKECPDYTNEGKFHFRVRSCLEYQKKICSDWEKTTTPLQLPDKILPPSFDIIGVFSETQLRIMNKPHQVLPINKSLNCYYGEALYYMIRYWSTNDSNQTPRENKQSFDMTLITLPLFEKPIHNAHMCVKLRITEETYSYESEWREVCKTVQPSPDIADFIKEQTEKSPIILAVTLTLGLLVVCIAIYKLKRAYDNFFKKEMDLPEKLAEILQEFDKNFGETSNPTMSRLDEITDHSNASECVEAFLPVRSTSSANDTDSEEDKDSMVAIASLSDTECPRPVVPDMSRADTSSLNDFMYIRNAASEGSSHYPAPERDISPDVSMVNIHKVDVHRANSFESCSPFTQDAEIEKAHEHAIYRENDARPSNYNFHTSEYTTIEHELARSLQMRACRTTVLETCVEDKPTVCLGNLHTSPSSSLDDVFLDGPAAMTTKYVKKRCRASQYEVENPTYSPQTHPQAEMAGTLKHAKRVPLNRSNSTESADSSHFVSTYVAKAETTATSRPKRSSLYQRRMHRRRRVHSFGYESIFNTPLHIEHQHGAANPLPAVQYHTGRDHHYCQRRSGCCSRCCSRITGRVEPVRNRSDSCRSADSGYPLDWSSFSDESPPPSPLDVLNLEHNMHGWHHRKSNQIRHQSHPTEIKTGQKDLSRTNSPQRTTNTAWPLEPSSPCADIPEASTVNTFFRPSSKCNFESSSYLELSSLPQMFPKIDL